MAEEEKSGKVDGERVPRDSMREDFFVAVEGNDRHLKEPWRQREFIANFASVLSAVLTTVAIVGAAIGLYSLGADRVDRTNQLEERAAESRHAIETIQKQIRDSDTKIASIERRLNNVPSSTPGSVPSVGSQEIELAVEELQKRVDGLGSVILDNPEKALSTVMLRRELQELKAASEGTALAVSREVDRVYDLTKWLFGLFLTMALGILTLVVTVALKAGRKGE